MVRDNRKAPSIQEVPGSGKAASGAPKPKGASQGGKALPLKRATASIFHHRIHHRSLG
jgi:hypothetical protein